MSPLMPQVNLKAIDLEVEEWLGGPSTNISNELGRPILIKVFQVNCPGCFSHGIPEVLEVRQKFIDTPLLVWGLATAFEDFHINTFENLQRLIDTGEVVGETLEVLIASGLLNNNCLDYSIPFPVAWDKVIPHHSDDYLLDAQNLIKKDFPNLITFRLKTKN